jgi:hypothetical protein
VVFLFKEQAVKKEIKQAFIADLQSNRALKCRYRLRRHDKFCALGRLAEVVEPGYTDDIMSNPGKKLSSLPRDFLKSIELSEDEAKDISDLNDRTIGFTKVIEYVRSLPED